MSDGFVSPIGDNVAPDAVSRSVRGNFLWISVGNAVFAACQWATVSVLAKLGNAEMVGVYALGVAIATPPLMLAQLNLRSVLATDVKQQHTFRDYRDLRFTSLIVTLLLLALFTVIRRSPHETAILLVGLMLAVQCMSDIYYGLLQAHERMERVAKSLVATSILSLGVLASTVKLTGSLTAGLSAMLVVRLIVFLLYDSKAAVREYIPSAPPRGGWQQQIEIVKTALPLGVVMMIGSLSPNLPRYFIAHHLGASALGIFSAIASLTTAANLLIIALGQASTPRLSKLYSAGNSLEFTRLLWRLIGIGVLLGMAGVAGAVLIGPQVLTVLFRSEYAAEAEILITLAFAAAASNIASLLGYAITACRCFRDQVPLQIASVMAVAIACLLLVPHYGLQGAAVSLGVGQIVQVVGEWIVLQTALAKIETPIAPGLQSESEGVAL